MDLSLLPTPASEYNKQRTDARFTVRSANSPSYSLTRRSAVRKPRGILEEDTEEVRDRERCRMDTSTNGTHKEEDHTVTGYQARGRSRSGVKGQHEEKETSGLKMSTKLNQNGSAERTITELGTANPASESRGRTDSRRNNLSSRSRSLDWTTGERSPDRGKRGYMLSTKRGGTGGLDEKGVEGGRGRVMSSVEYYNSARTSNDAPDGQMLDRASRGHTLPSRFRSQPLLGPKGGQSIQERIEKLYGSTGVGKSEDGNKTKDFSTQKSYERASGGTFPRRFSSGENSGGLSPKQSRRSFTWTERDTSGSESYLSPGTSKTTESLSRGQWQGQTQSRYSEGSKWLEDIGTMSLDRARSRCTVASRIRSARAAQSNTLLEEGRSDLSRLRERREGESKDQGRANHPEEKGKTNGLNKTFRDRRGWLKEQGKGSETELKSSSTDEDVFESNPQKNTIKTIDRKKVPEKSSVSTAASVKNKIHQFEALTQRSQGSATGQALMPRRAFSVPMQLSRAHDGVKKSGSAKAIGGLRDKWDSLKEGEEEKEEEKATGAGKKLASGRSLSVDEVGLRLVRKEKEGNDLVEKKEKDTDNVNNSAEDFDKYSRLRRTLEIPLDGGSQRRRRNFYIDETDFCKVLSPEEASERSPSSLPSNSSDTSAGVQTTTIVTSPVSDEDKTPTNTPDHSPFRSPTAQPENPAPVAGSEKESTSVLTQAAKTPDQESWPLPRPLATSSHSNLPDLISPDISPNRKKRVLDLDAWVAGLNPNIKVWNDDENYEDDDESTQKDDDSNYDSDSGESSVTVTSYMSQSDRKSFCVSLSDLCNFAGVDYESENDSDEWQPTSRRTASLSSDVSALSYVSVMPSEELDKLLEDVRGLGDNNLQDYDDVQVVVLHKDVGVGLGFSLAGGIDQNKPVTVHKVFHSGVAAQEGSIREGDQVLSINGTSLCGYIHWEALRVLRRAKCRDLGVVVLRRGGTSSACKGGAQTNGPGPTQAEATEKGELLCVRLEKNNRDLGFSLEGGVGSSQENRPLTVQKIFQEKSSHIILDPGCRDLLLSATGHKSISEVKHRHWVIRPRMLSVFQFIPLDAAGGQGGPVDKVCPGDEVLEIEGVSMVGMRRLEAWTLIRKLPSGPVDVVLRRSLKNLET